MKKKIMQELASALNCTESIEQADFVNILYKSMMVGNLDIIPSIPKSVECEVNFEELLDKVKQYLKDTK